MLKYDISAYAHMYEVKVITITSLGDYHTKIKNTTPVESGVITGLTNAFRIVKKPFYFEFIWQPNKFIPASFTNAVKIGTEFSLDLRLQVRDERQSLKSHHQLSFAQCKLRRSSRAGKQVKVEASCNYFQCVGVSY